MCDIAVVEDEFCEDGAALQAEHYVGILERCQKLLRSSNAVEWFSRSPSFRAAICVPNGSF